MTATRTLETDGPEYTIDELAAEARVPSRTIRFYQSKGALPGPLIRGRVAFYGTAHVERLRLIAELQDRGLRIKAIRDLVGRIDKGELALNEWLGLEQQLQTPWANDKPRVLSEEELYGLAGDRRPGLIGDLVQVRLIKRQGDGFLVPSPGLLQVSMRLEGAGVDLETSAGGGALVRKHLAKLAADLAEYFFKRAGKGMGRQATAQDLGEAFEQLRPKSQEAIQFIFAQEMSRELRRLVESGKTAQLPVRKKK